MTNEDLELIKAEQQLAGYYYGLEAKRVAEVVNDMGLSADEWHKMKRRNMVSWMPDSMRAEIDSYLLVIKK